MAKRKERARCETWLKCGHVRKQPIRRSTMLIILSPVYDMYTPSRVQSLSEVGSSMVKFIVLSTQRSGSSFLCTSLDSHPRIRCHEEIFMTKNTNAITYRSYRTGSFERKLRHAFGRNELIYTYLNEFFRDKKEVDALGFKFMYGQNRQYPQVRQWCKERNVKVIHLIRENTLKIIVSRHVAKKRSVYMSTEPLQPASAKLDIWKLKAEIRKARKLVETNRNLFSACACMEVFYENFVNERGKESKRILNFLEADASEQLTTSLIKTSQDEIGPSVENYQEVCKVLSGSPYEQFLD